MSPNTNKYEVVKIPQKSPEFGGQQFPTQSELYLELMENPNKIKNELLGVEYEPSEELQNGKYDYPKQYYQVEKPDEKPDEKPQIDVKTISRQLTPVFNDSSSEFYESDMIDDSSEDFFGGSRDVKMWAVEVVDELFMY